MPAIKISDNFGLAIDVEPNPSSSLVKYFKNLLKLRFAELNFAELTNTALDNLPLSALAAGISFDEPVGIGTDAAELTIGAGVRAALESILSEDGAVLFPDDHYGDPIAIPQGGAFVSFAVTANVAAGVGGGRNNLAFGVDAGREVTLTCYQRFRTAKVPFPEAFRTTLQNFVIPSELADLAAMPEGSISTVEGNGALTFSGNASLPSITNPLLAASLPLKAGKIALSGGTSVSVGASFSVTGEYQIRIQKIGPARCQLGYHRKNGTEFGIRASAKAGLSLKVGGSELIKTLLKAVSKNPEVDGKELEQLGMAEEQVQAIDGAIRAGVERSLEVAVSLELGVASSRAAAFLYEIDLEQLNASGKQALERALHGDLSSLTESEEDDLPAGIRATKSIFTAIRQSKHAMKINLLGIYNFISVTELVRNGSILFDPLTGELTISDTVTASRIRASMTNFATNTSKLRQVLAEQFLITALYRSTKLAAGTPSLRSTHSYFEKHAKTNRQTMKDNLDVAEALQLLSANEKAGILGGFNDFGPSLLLADMAYDDAATRSLFLKDGKPRSEDDYDRIGREALGRLIQPGDTEPFRRIPVNDDALWAEMKRTGQPGFGRLFPGLTSAQLEVIRSDYTVIRWWSQTMHRMSLELENADNFFAANPAVNPESDQFTELRERIAKSLENVAKNTKGQFGDPWGLVAMDLASGQRAEGRFRLTSARSSVDRVRDTKGQAVTGSA
jgi:hypothetical protein